VIAPGVAGWREGDPIVAKPELSLEDKQLYHYCQWLSDEFTEIEEMVSDLWNTGLNGFEIVHQIRDDWGQRTVELSVDVAGGYAWMIVARLIDEQGEQQKDLLEAFTGETKQ